MNVIIKREDIGDYSDIHGGGCASVILEIIIDSRLDKRVQRNLVVHEILESYFRSVEHEKIEELVDIISDALDELEES